jgi:hypothetical protein
MREKRKKKAEIDPPSEIFRSRFTPWRLTDTALVFCDLPLDTIQNPESVNPKMLEKVDFHWPSPLLE